MSTASSNSGPVPPASRRPSWRDRFLQSIAILSSALILGGLGFATSVLLPIAAADYGSELAQEGAYLVLLLTLHFISIANARFLLRLLPLPTSGKRRRGVVATLCAVAVPSGVAGLYRVFWEPEGGDWTLALVWRPLLLLVSATCARLAWRHWRAPHLLNRPFILFLRRFASFSDRSLLISALQAAPPGVPVFMIGGPLRDTAAWDPFLLAFHGMKPWRAFASSPVFFFSPDEHWEEVVRGLTQRARCVLMDTTEATPSLRVELDMLRTLPAERVVLLRDREPSRLEQDAPWPEGGRLLVYRKGWLASVPRIFLGLSLAVLTTLALSVGLRGGPVYNVLNTGDPFHALREALGEPLHWFVFPLFAPLFLRKTLTHGSMRQLREAIRGALATPDVSGR